MIRKNFVCLALFATTILFSALSFAGKPQKSESLRTVSLDVTIEDSDTAIYSDGKGDYSDGVDIHSAELGSGGNLAIAFGPPSQHGKTQSLSERKVCFDFNDSLDLDCPYNLCGTEIPFDPPATTDCVGGSDMVTRPLPDPGALYTPLQNLTLNQSEIVELYWTLHYNGNTLNWRINFHSNLADYEGSPSAYAIVTCTDSVDHSDSTPCTTWTVEPYQPDQLSNGDLNPYSSPIALLVKGELEKNVSTQTPEQFFNMPFKLTLTARP